MRILNINKYYALRGGADREMFNLEEILKAHGHDVIPFAQRIPENKPSEYQDYFAESLNWDVVAESSLMHKIRSFGKIIHNRDAERRLTMLVKEVRPQVAHIHNFTYDLSPSILNALRDHAIPTIMHLHDTRMFCPNGYMFVNGKFCNRCFYHKFYHAALNRCMRDSLSASVAVTLANYSFRLRKVWTNLIDAYISPTDIIKRFAVESGINEKKIRVMSHPISLERFQPSEQYEDFIMFLGYWVEQKGIFNLIRAMKGVRAPLRLKIFGHGPEERRMRQLVEAEELGNVEICGFIPTSDIFDQMRKCLFVVIPSLGFENSNAVIREANALGRPVLASRTGGIPELIQDGETGILVNGFDVNELTDAINRMAGHREATACLGKNARKFVENTCSYAAYYRNLREVYKFLNLEQAEPNPEPSSLTSERSPA